MTPVLVEEFSPSKNDAWFVISSRFVWMPLIVSVMATCFGGVGAGSSGGF